MPTAHLLVVEDNADVRSAMRIIFEGHGYRVTGAASLAEAAEVCAADRPDAVLLDLTLPDGDGLQLLARLQGNGHRAPVTLALTGHDDEPTRQRCLAAGCADVLLKPVPPREIARRLAAAMAHG